MPNHRRRNSNRLDGYDYSLPGAYFVTIATYRRAALFGHNSAGEAILNDLGLIAQEEWRTTVELRREVRLDEFIIMPNHIHAILFIDEITLGERAAFIQTVGAHGRAPLQRRPRTLGSMIAAYKAATTRRIREHSKTPDLTVWQRNFYDRIIRDQLELDNVREYIHYNPLKLSEG